MLIYYSVFTVKKKIRFAVTVCKKVVVEMLLATGTCTLRETTIRGSHLKA